MKSTLVIVFLFLVIKIELLSQELNIGVESGIGLYEMNDLKEINDMNLSSLPFDAKITESFPSYWVYKPSLMFTFQRLFSVGVTYSFQSTGSRISLVDYSGEYYFDNKIKSSSPGISVEFYYNVSKIRLAFGNEVGVEYSKMRLTEYLRLYSSSRATNSDFKSKNFYYEPSFKITYTVSCFKIGLVFGYLMDLKKGDLLSTSNNNTMLILSGGSAAQADWTGIRVKVSLSCNLFQLSKSDKVRN